MSRALVLAGVSYQPITTLHQGPGVTWQLVRQAGTLHLLQAWEPRPAEKDVEHLKHRFLQGLQEALPCDPPQQAFTQGTHGVWFLQALQGRSLVELWRDLGLDDRKRLRDGLDRTPGPRAWFTEGLAFQGGRLRVPRCLGQPVRTQEDLLRDITGLTPPPVPAAPGPLTAPDLGQDCPLPLLGRTREATWLKTLMMGLQAPLPMERIVVLQGEPGLGHAALCRWAAAVAQTEGIWVHELPAGTSDALGTLVDAALQGIEADFYAAHPEAARRLGRRVPAFTFLLGDRTPASPMGNPDPEEIRAALVALVYAQAHHPRLVILPELSEATPLLLELIREFTLGVSCGWLLPVATTTPGSALKVLLGALAQGDQAATLQLGRLEDEDLLHLADRLLSPHTLPAAALRHLAAAALGNPGLLQDLLELCQQNGVLRWDQGHWTVGPEGLVLPREHTDLAERLLVGRLRRLRGTALAALRLLALREGPLSADSLGKALGLAGDPLDEVMEPLHRLRFVRPQAGRLVLADPRLPALVLRDAPEADLQRLARALLKVLDQKGQGLPPVPLLVRVLDRATALERVLCALDGPPPPPLEASCFVHEAMALEPDALQRARLWSFLAQAWGAGGGVGRLPAPAEHHNPLLMALEAYGLAEVSLAEADLQDPHALDLRAALLRRKGDLQLELGRLAEARTTIIQVATLLHERPLHPEQPRLCGLLGRLHLADGYLTKALKAFEDGLQQLAHQEGPDTVHDRVRLLLGAGEALGHRGLVQRALQTLEAARRLLQQVPCPRLQVGTAIALAEMRLHLGQSDPACRELREALDVAHREGDPALSARCHLAVGTLRSLQGSLEAAGNHLRKARDRFTGLGDTAGASQATLWLIRTQAALGDRIEAELHLVQFLGSAPPPTTHLETAERFLVQAEVTRLLEDPRGAARLYQRAAEAYEQGGFLWRERLSRLRRLQVQAALAGEVDRLEAWEGLERLKAPVEASGSRLLDMEWLRAHGLLLGALPMGETLVVSALEAWDGVLGLARSLDWQMVVLSACVESAAVLLHRGERLGARSRLQEAFTALHLLICRAPESATASLLTRQEPQRLRVVAAQAGLPFELPERAEPLADWTPTQILLEVAPE